MISVQKAKSLILQNTSCQSCEKIYFSNALGRVLARDLCATSDWPPFSRALMDGFALRHSDVQTVRLDKPGCLTVIGVAQAGLPFNRKILKNQAVQIMTGALIPQGADCVIMKEDTARRGKEVLIFKKIKRLENVRLKGQDVKKGEIILTQGVQISPGVLALLANMGIMQVWVHQQPRVGIVCTGDELVAPHQHPGRGQLRSANEYALSALVQQVGGVPVILGIARDHLTDLTAKIKKGLVCDVLLISGGVSVGERDLVLTAFEKLGVQKIFWKVAIKPGKPLFFGKRGRCHVFGLPGNTVSSIVSFEQFVKPCLLKMSGCREILSKTTQAILSHEIRVEPLRHKVMRGFIFTQGMKRYVRLSAHQVSENVLSVAKANCLFEIDPGITVLKKGSCICAQYL